MTEDRENYPENLKPWLDQKVKEMWPEQWDSMPEPKKIFWRNYVYYTNFDPDRAKHNPSPEKNEVQ